MRIQHNIMAMNAYRNYNTNTKALSSNLEKLSSGYKINRAGDDAAGLAISEKMRAQITGLDAAQKNVKDGISLVKTAEGAMQEIQDMLNRMDYLATQSANGTYDNEVDRANLQKEVEALKTEINRIADSANFNGIKLLDGSLDTSGNSGVAKSDVQVVTSGLDCEMGQLHKPGTEEQEPSFQIDLKQALQNAKVTASASSVTLKIEVGGTNVSVTIKATLAAGQVLKFDDSKFKTTASSVSASTVTIGSMTFKVSVSGGVVKFEYKATATGNYVRDLNCKMDVKITASGNAVTFASKGNGGSYNCFTQNVVDGVANKPDQLAHGHFDLTEDMLNTLVQGGTLTIGDTPITFDTSRVSTTGISNGAIGVKDLLDDKGNFNYADKDAVKKVASLITQAASGDSVFTVGAASDGTSIKLQEKYDYYTATNGKTLIDTDEKFSSLVQLTGAVAKSANGKGLILQIGDTADDFNQMGVSVGNMHTYSMISAESGKSIADINIGTQEGAKEAVQVIRDAINYVSGVRGDLGAVQNRLEHTGNNLAVMAENIQDAESTIRDTDVADEMMKYVKNNILVQSAQAMLAQANQVPQGVLQLLG